MRDFVKVVKAKSMKLLMCARNAHARGHDVRFLILEIMDSRCWI